MRSTERVLSIIEALARSDRPQGVSELAKALRLDKATVYRILSVLSDRGYVQQDPATRRYSLDSRMVALSAQVLSKADLPQRARPYLAELVRRTRQSAHLAVLSKEAPQWAVYIGQKRSPSRVQVDIRVGHMAPTHCTAVGKALLAYLPREQLTRLAPDGKLQRLTARTSATVDTLEHQLRVIRERGYAVDDEEFHRNIRCVAAPVRAGDGSVVASIGISGIAADIPREAIPKIAAVVVQVADQLSREFGHVAPVHQAAARRGHGRRLTVSRV